MLLDGFLGYNYNTFPIRGCVHASGLLQIRVLGLSGTAVSLPVYMRAVPRSYYCMVSPSNWKWHICKP